MGIVREVFSTMDVESMLLGIAFVILLAVLMFILGRIRIFQKNQGVKTIVGICISLLAVYGISKSRWDIEGFFYNLGFGINTVYVLIIPAIIAFFIITMIATDEITGRRRFRIYRSFIIAGLIFIILKFTPMAYGNGALYVGIPLLVIGLLLWNAKRKRIKKYFRERHMNPAEYLREKDRLKKKENQDKVNNQVNITNIYNAEQQKQERAKREQRLRSRAELQGKYKQYSDAIIAIQQKNNGKIPALGTPDGDLRHRYIQAMKAIENLAKDQGFELS